MVCRDRFLILYEAHAMQVQIKATPQLNARLMRNIERLSEHP